MSLDGDTQVLACRKTHVDLPNTGSRREGSKPYIDERITRMTKRKIDLTSVLFCIYCLILIWVVLFKASLSWDAIRLLVREREINLIPFFGLGELVLLNREMLLNVIVFVPMGAYLCMLNISAPKAVLYGFLVSLGFELCQLLTRLGTFDVTDLITNTFGTAIGACAYLLLKKLFGDQTKLNRAINVMALTVAAAFAVLALLLFVANR